MPAVEGLAGRARSVQAYLPLCKEGKGVEERFSPRPVVLALASDLSGSLEKQALLQRRHDGEVSASAFFPLRSDRS
jgi:hypothetical protein